MTGDSILSPHQPPQPPPPPPPPPLPRALPSLQSKQTCISPATSAAENEDPVATVAFRAARATWYHRLILHLNEAPPLIQEGATCGLVATAMALHMLGARDVTVAQLLEEAQRRQMSSQGEMFSARDLAYLVAGRLPEPHSAELRRDFGDAAAVARAVLAGDAVLVPYDADSNHEPCLRRGATAHWALVCGLLVGTAADADDPRQTDGRPLTADELVYPQPPTLVSAAAARTARLQPEPAELLLVCRQGKSRRLAVWRHAQLAESNAQLLEARPPRPGELPYVLSQGSAAAGLCGQWVRLGGGRGQHPLADWLLAELASVRQPAPSEAPTSPPDVSAPLT